MSYFILMYLTSSSSFAQQTILLSLTQNKCLFSFNFSTLPASSQRVYLLLLTHFDLVFFKRHNCHWLLDEMKTVSCAKSN